MDASPSRAQSLSAAAVAATLLFAVTAHAQTPHVDTRGLQAGEQHDRFIVQYRADAQVHHVDTARRRVHASVALSPVGTMPILPTVLHAMAPGGFVVRSSAPMNAVAAEAWMRRLAADKAVESIEVDTKLYEHALPNDKWYATQPHLFGTYGVGADITWYMGELGHGFIQVGVIDSGPSPNPDVDAAWLGGYDFVDNDLVAATPNCPGSTHGTQVAGMIAASTNNKRGVASVAPKIRVVPARVVPGCGGEGEHSRLSDFVRAIDWLSGTPVQGVPVNPHFVEVINISMGVPAACGAAMQGAITRAVARRTSIVVSAGNEGFDASRVMPANCNDVIVVGATHVQGWRSWFSNWGPTVDLAAPGEMYWPSNDDSTVGEMYGTSYSAPIVTGIVALMHANTTVALTPAQIETYLKASAKPFRAPLDQALGAGIVNAPAALAMVESVPERALDGAYVIVPRGLLPGQQHWNGCLIVGNNGNATHPSFHRWGGSGAPETCGLGNDDTLVANRQAVWDITPVTDSRGITAHVIRSRVNGKCLIRSNNGTDASASLYLWGDIADKRWCGLPSADAFIANGQAAWFGWAVRRQGNGEIVTTVDLKQARPNFGFLGFAPTGTPGVTHYNGRKAWEFDLYPVPALPK